MTNFSKLGQTLPNLNSQSHSWDARHLTNFLNSSQYSNRIRPSNQAKSNFGYSNNKSIHKKPIKNDFFFRTTSVDKNVSKIGFTPVFNLVTNSPIQPKNQTLRDFFRQSKTNGFYNGSKSRQQNVNDEDIFNKTPSLSLRKTDNFKFQSSSVKFKQTDPITLSHELPQAPTGYQTARMERLIQCRHPHGMTGLDHNQNPQSQFYKYYQDQIRIRQQPNSHMSFQLSREWKSKGRGVEFNHDPPKKRDSMRKDRNINVHGYDIITNRRT